MSDENAYLEEFRRHEREFIEFKAVAEERQKANERRFTDLLTAIEKRDALAEKHESAQSALTLDLNQRVTTIEAELKTGRRHVAIMIAIGSGLAATIATLIPMLFA